jgi:hypothetical protein
MCHRRIDEIPSSIIGTPHKPETIIVEEDDVTIAVAPKDDPLIAWSRSDQSRPSGDAHRAFTPL